MNEFRLILIIFIYFLLVVVNKSKINNSKKIDLDFENRYKNIGFALIYDDNLKDIKKLDVRSLNIYHKSFKKKIFSQNYKSRKW